MKSIVLRNKSENKSNHQATGWTNEEKRAEQKEKQKEIGTK